MNCVLLLSTALVLFFFNLLPYKKKNFPHDKILIFGLTLVGRDCSGVNFIGGQNFVPL